MSLDNLKHFRITVEDKIAHVDIDRADKKVNAFNEELITELESIVDAIDGMGVDGVIFKSAKKTGFFVGADIDKFSEIKSPDEGYKVAKHGQNLFDKLAALKTPTLAVISGPCMGGGTEFSLACRYRIAEDNPKTRIGLPEVMLGILAAWGGVQRMPALIGAPAALDLLLSGRALSASAARKVGLVDYSVSERVLDKAAVQLIKEKPAPRRLKGIQKYTNSALGRKIIAKIVRKKVRAKANPQHYPAIYRTLDIFTKYGTSKKSFEKSAQALGELLLTSTSQSLVRVFNLQTEMKGVAKGVDYKAQSIMVIGCGTMGASIAMVAALKGVKVYLNDREPKFIASALAKAYKFFKKKLKKPVLIQNAMDNLIPDIQGDAIPHVDMFIEAIIEDPKAKQDLFTMLESKAKPEAILATNTSSISIHEIASALKQPSRLVGIHFFNPVEKMMLVEVIKSDETDEAVVKNALAYVTQIGKLPILVKDSPGFVVNRILMPYMMEALMLLEEGASVLHIDKAAKDFGMPTGPIELADTVGLDICLHVAEYLSDKFQGDIPERLKKMVADGNLGAKTGKGFYEYKGKKKVGPVDAKGSDNSDITDRIVLRYIKECALCLEERIIDSKDMLDAGMIFGTGFAPFRGGPINYANKVGHDELKEKFDRLTEKCGERFAITECQLSLITTPQQQTSEEPATENIVTA